MLTSIRARPEPVAVTRIVMAGAALVMTYEGHVALSRAGEGRMEVPVAPWLPSAEAIPPSAWSALMLAATISLLLGWRPALGALTLALGNAVLLLTDWQMYSNHRYLFTLLAVWLIFAQSDRALAPRAAARRQRSGDTVLWWPQLLMMVTVSSVYVFAGLSKINAEYLTGVVIASNAPAWVPSQLAAWATILTELAIGLGLWFRRTRIIAVALGMGLHVSIMALMSPHLVNFALPCWAVYPLFLRRPALTPPQVAEPVVDSGLAR